MDIPCPVNSSIDWWVLAGSSILGYDDNDEHLSGKCWGEHTRSVLLVEARHGIDGYVSCLMRLFFSAVLLFHSLALLPGSCNCFPFFQLCFLPLTALCASHCGLFAVPSLLLLLGVFWLLPLEKCPAYCCLVLSEQILEIVFRLIYYTINIQYVSE